MVTVGAVTAGAGEALADGCTRGAGWAGTGADMGAGVVVGADAGAGGGAGAGAWATTAGGAGAALAAAGVGGGGGISTADEGAGVDVTTIGGWPGSDAGSARRAGDGSWPSSVEPCGWPFDSTSVTGTSSVG